MHLPSVIDGLGCHDDPSTHNRLLMCRIMQAEEFNLQLHTQLVREEEERKRANERGAHALKLAMDQRNEARRSAAAAERARNAAQKRAETAEMAAAAAAARVEQMRTRELDAVARRIEPRGGGRRRRSLRRQKAMAALSEAIEATAEATADHVPEGTLKTLWEAARDCYAAWEAAESEQLGRV